jgi:hypothetical protein
MIALLRRRGAAARRIADALDTIELVLDDVDGAPHRIVSKLQPPQARHGRLRDIEFGVREQESPR